MWCQVCSSHIHASHKTPLNYNSKHRGKKSLTNKYMRNPAGIKLCISNQNTEFCLNLFLNNLLSKRWLRLIKCQVVGLLP